MLFYRARTGTKDIPLPWVRALSLLALAAYPIGALILALGSARVVAVAAGYGLILAALIAAAALVGSSAQRIVGEQPEKLDEYEVHLRQRTLSLSYACFTVLVLLTVVYGAIAADKGLWLPRTYGEFNGLFWGVFLYASLLPTAVLAWALDAEPA